jgi:DHA2 family multidrug resistance protein
MMLAGRLIARRDPRLLVGVGLILAALGTHVMTRYSLDISPGWVLWPGVLQGLGLGMIFVPLSSIAFDTLPGSASAEAAGLFSLIRTLGGSVGISAVSTVLSRQGQASWHGLGGAVSPFNPSLQTWLDRTGLNLRDTLAPQILAKELYRQSTMVAYADVFWVITAGFVLLLPVLVLMRRPHHQQHRGNGPVD